MKEKILLFMKENFLLKFDESLNEESDLFKSKVIDSIGYINLIKFLEKEFAIKFSEDEILSNVLVSFSGILNSVAKKVEAVS